MQCPTCKQELESGIRFCPHDGTPLTETTSAAPTHTPSTRAATAPSAGARETALPFTVGGRYRLVELRGGGGMAKVYRAVDITLEREVAVKLINPELRSEAEFDARFQREARIASQLSDPHIIVVHDFGIDPAQGPYLVMEYLRGQSLREQLQSEGPLSLPAGLQMSTQLMLALIHAHDKNIIHRDIKPDNVFLLKPSGAPSWLKRNRLQVRILDFGIARIYRRHEGDNVETLTNPGAVIGTPRYMSPEQLAGQPVESPSDLYSAALVIHESLTGQLPYVCGKRLRELCPAAPPALQNLLDQCLKPNPVERPSGAAEVYLRLQKLGKMSSILSLAPGFLDREIASRQAAEPTIAYSPPPSRMRRRLVLAVMMLLVLLGLAGLGKHFLFPNRPIDRQHASLLDVHIGDPQQEVVERLKLTKGGPMNPWETGRAPRYLGNVLRAKDLDLPAGALARLDVQRSEDERVCVLFHNEQVWAVIARAPHRAATGRGLKIGDRHSRVMDFYPEVPSEDVGQDVRGVNGEKYQIEVRRYDALGIGFELREGKVTAITLYPARAAP